MSIYKGKNLLGLDWSFVLLIINHSSFRIGVSSILFSLHFQSSNQMFFRAGTSQIDIVQLESNFLFLFQSRILRSQLTKNPSILEDVTSKPNTLPDMFALQQMKALQAAQNPAFKALVDARGKSKVIFRILLYLILLHL